MYEMPPGVVVTKADKSGILIAISEEEYKAIGLDFLQQNDVFEMADNCGLEEFQRQLKCLRDRWIMSPAWSNEWDQALVIPDDLREKSIYFLLKIHKPKNGKGLIKGRPITDSVGTYGSIIDKFLYKLVRSKRFHLKTIIHNSQQVLEKIRNLNRIRRKECWLLTADISDMYNQIPINEAVDGVRKFLKETGAIPHNNIELFLVAMELVLRNNIVCFDDKWYKQTKGVAMGANLSPFIANCWLGYMEKDLFRDIPMHLGGRYLDDILGIFSKKDIAEYFGEEYRKLHPNIKLECEISNETANFLDIHLRMEGGLLMTDVFFKPSDVLALLHRHSCHPKHTFSAVIESQLIRFVRICSSLNSFRSAAISLFTSLTKRKYEWEEILRACRKVLHKCTELKNWPYVKKKEWDEEMEQGVSQYETLNVVNWLPRMDMLYRKMKAIDRIAFKVGKNLKSRLCRSNFKK